MKDYDAEIVWALRWIDENDHTRSRWLVNGRPPRREKSDKWTHIELSGENAMIRIAADVWVRARDFIGGGFVGKRMFTITDEGRALIRASRDTPASQDQASAQPAKPHTQEPSP